MHSLTVQAISAALTQQWDTAVTLNQKILQDDSADYDALNRLAYAFFELGRFDEAKEMFFRVLELDPKNLIATRNIDKIDKMISQNGANHHEEGFYDDIEPAMNPQLFLDEPGKTKTTNLIRIAAKDVLSPLRIGVKLELITKSRNVAVLAPNDICIGYLPDDLAFSLCRFITGGNQYDAYVRSVAPNLVSIFIREIKQSDRFMNIPSFMDAKKRSASHVYRASQEPPTAIADEDALDYQEDLDKDMFEIE